MQLRTTLFFIVPILFMACHTKQTDPVKPVIKDSTIAKKDSTISKVDPTENTNDDDSFTAVDYSDAKIYVDSVFNLKKALPAYTEDVNIESGKHDDAPINKIILIGNMFSPTIKHAILIYRSSDSTLNCRIYEYTSNTWTKDIDVDLPSLTSELDSLVAIEDINGDKIPDLMITEEYSTMAIHTAGIAEAWLFDGKTFKAVKEFDNIYNAAYDPSTNEVYSYTSIGCADLSKYFGEYKIVNNKAVLLKEVSCDCCLDDDADSNNCHVSINNAKPITVKRSKVSKYAPGFYREMYKQELEEK